MTLLVTGYDSKNQLKASIGKPLQYQETSIFGEEYVSNGVVTVANRPHLTGRGREFFARVHVKDDKITKVE